MEGMDTDLSLPQSVEFVDAMCLEKSIILSDGCTTATITTVDGQALPVTFIVSPQLQDNASDVQSVQDLINSGGVSIVGEQTEGLKLNNAKDDPSSVFAVHFPTDNKPVEQSFLPPQESNILCESKSNDVEEPFNPDALTNHKSSSNKAPVSRLEDFMDVVTTYKCKFCRFSCPWKAGLMSHIRCCHINEKQNIVTVKAEKESAKENSTKQSTTSKSMYNSVTENIEPVQPKDGIYVQSQNSNAQTENCNYTVIEQYNPDNQSFVEASSCNLSQSENSFADVDVRKPELCETENSLNDKFNKDCSDKDDSNPFFENCDVDTDNENSSSVDSPVERHIFLCGQCSDGFASLDECKQHMIEDHNLKLDQSDIKPLRKRGRPRKYFPKEEDKDAPMQSVSNDNAPKHKKRQSRPPRILTKDFECGTKKKIKKDSFKMYRCTKSPTCACKFSSEQFLLYHYSCHTEVDKSFVCPSCNELFEFWRVLVMHLWKEHTIDIDLFACSDCPYKTYSGFKLNNHKKIHSDERSYVCETCGKGFKQISQLRNHVVIHLDRKSITEKRWYSEQTCDICGRKFSDAKCLRKHKQAVHKKLKPYSCTFCGHLSARKAMLELHMRQHTGEKPFICEHCDYRTGDHNSLRRHRMRHTGAKPYKCPHCPYACIQAISYKTHLRNKHPGMEGLYCCTFCSFKSVSRENYVHHVSDHKRQGSTVEMDAEAAAATIIPEALDPGTSDPSSVQMQLTDNAVQQLEGILPSNVTAAQLIYSCLNALNQDGGTVNLPAGVTVNIPQGVSNMDGTQTITIQLPSGQDLDNEQYYFAIQPDGSTSTLVLPTDEQNDENAQAATDLAGVQFDDNHLADASGLDCDAILHDGHSVVPDHVANSVQINISPVEGFGGAAVDCADLVGS